jgi:hypothetical protein
MKIFAVIIGGNKLAIVEDAEGKIVHLASRLEEDVPQLQRVLDYMKSQGVDAELKEFEVAPPYGLSLSMMMATVAAENPEGINLQPHPLCICENPMQAMFCPYGHMMECHLPLSCKEAQCSHLSKYE